MRYILKYDHCKKVNVACRLFKPDGEACDVPLARCVRPNRRPNRAIPRAAASISLATTAGAA